MIIQNPARRCESSTFQNLPTDSSEGENYYQGFLKRFWTWFWQQRLYYIFEYDLLIGKLKETTFKLLWISSQIFS